MIATYHFIGLLYGLKHHSHPNTINHLCSNNVDRIYLSSTLEMVCKVVDIDIQELIEVE
ncbi:helix-turn-helix domain-containing protein [Gracilibacillus kekensis]|uniref:helix-turn-helix domain-containing protein n=1 Tax=Gracilibacillus kekensis TaxID=1027249 RepID=UPI001FCE075D|nr:helix-turn-helix transcriptional regulator [Gracilibacillus kekensis]